MSKIFFFRGRKNSFRYFILPILLLCLLSVIGPSASADDTGYTIKSYSADISISSDNVYSVNDDIEANFTEPRHGIYFYIPEKQTMDWKLESGPKTITYNTRVGSVSASGDHFSAYRENGDMVIQVGDADRTITGDKLYKISYTHSLGDDKVTQGDIVYYNLVGTQWDCSISNVSFKVTLPKDFDKSKIYFYSGPLYSSGAAPVSYKVDGSTITGTLKGTLSAGEGLTLMVSLPEGYFTYPAPFPWATVFMAVSALLSILALLLFLLFGRDPVLVKSVEFYPPDNITSAEAGYIIDNLLDNKDVASLIIYWASKGYLSIEQTHGLVLTKLKDLPGEANEYEKHMFGQLFYSRSSVSVDELKENFYTTIDTTERMILEMYSGKDKRMYDTKSLVLRRLTSFFASLLIFGTVFYTIYINTLTLLTPALFSLAATVLITLPFANLTRTLEQWNGLKALNRVSKLIANIIFGALLLCGYVFYMYLQDLLAVGIEVALSAAFITVMSILMRKRTKGGNEILGKLLGFKNFLEVAEKPRLEKLVEENPSYFYDVLPYAYVLGVSDKWAKKFDSIAMRPPEWYYGGSGMNFTPLIFQQMLFHSMFIMNTNMIARPAPPPSSNTGGGGFGGGGFGGGFGGGGFSGGGFGGGGGGSW